MKNAPRYLGVVALAAAIFFFAGGGCATVTPEEAKVLVRDQGALLVDVRTEEEFSAGHLEGAVNIPVQELEARLGSFPARKDQPVVLYCRSGSRSGRALNILKQAGYSRVVNLGAMSNWK